jgi:phosphoglycolate phosphatase-like HAD superfamily hydrolase
MNKLPAEVELVNPRLKRGSFRSVLFDFDGTLSLIREGWPQVMVPMMVEVLRQTPTKETDAELANKVEEFVMRLNGRQTIYQMIQLTEEVKVRGGVPLEPLAYKHHYHDRLMQRIRGRIEALENSQAAPADWCVPGTRQLLEALHNRGLKLYLASGTDWKYVRKEVELLGLTCFFGEHIYGALDDYWNFSKQMIVAKIIRDHGLSGAELLGFGDGFVEIEEIRKVGGVAIGVASDEVRRQGVNAWKRARLIQAGADIIIPDYRQGDELLDWLLQPVG